MSDLPTGADLVAYRVAEARKAHARGLVLTPVNGKVPIGKEWQMKAPPKLEAVESMARKGNVGLRTGIVSGVFGIDDDTEDQSAATTLGLPTSTPTIITGSGHHNRLYKVPDFPVGNSVGKLAGHVDVRAESGMLVYVGSEHPITHRPYVWAVGLSLDDVEFADLPDEILDRLRPRPKTARPTPSVSIEACADSRPMRYAVGALRGAALRVFDAIEGARNDTLNREAFALARFVAAGLLTRERIEDVLYDAARSAGLLDAEISSTLRSGLDSGLRSSQPFVMPEAQL